MNKELIELDVYSDLDLINESIGCDAFPLKLEDQILEQVGGYLKDNELAKAGTLIAMYAKVYLENIVEDRYAGGD